MPKSQLEIDIEKATNENLTQEDWTLILDIVDRINQTHSEKEALKLIVRRLNAKDPHIAMHSLALLNACVNNCTRNFKLEVCSRDFTDEIRQIILKKKYPKLSEKLAFLVFEWSNDKEFKNDPALSLMSSLYADLKKNGIEFKKEDGKSGSGMVTAPRTTTTTNTTAAARKEEDDLAKAIQLSLNETKQPKQANAASLYSQLPTVNIDQPTYKRKVKALYDFEAAEENELTFKSGDLLYILDDSDENWWKGANMRHQQGLFPSNFVTPDLNAEIESFNTNGEQDSGSKKVSFNDEVSVKTLLPIKIVIDERKIDECIDLIQDADPTGEIKPDTDEFLQLEDMCYAMGPLIDQELQHIDQKHAMLEDLNIKLLEAFQMYNNLMKESLLKQNTATMPMQGQGMMMPGQGVYPSQQFSPQYQYGGGGLPVQQPNAGGLQYMPQQPQFIPQQQAAFTPGQSMYGGSGVASGPPSYPSTTPYQMQQGVQAMMNNSFQPALQSQHQGQGQPQQPTNN